MSINNNEPVVRTSVTGRFTDLSTSELPARLSEQGFEELKSELEEQFRFETLLNDISSRFINIPSHQVTSAIEDTQRLFCEALDLDRSSLFQSSGEKEHMMLLTHIYQRPDLPFPIEKRAESGSNTTSYWRRDPASPHHEYLRIDARQMYPWFYAKARRGETAIVPRVQGLGPDAVEDKKHLSRFGTQSTVVVPLIVAGNWLGMLTFGSVRRPRDWPASLIKRFEFIASVYASALARARAETSLIESEERYRLLFETESDAILLADSESGKIVDANAAALEMYDYTLQEFLGLHCNELSLQPENPLPVISSTENLSTQWHRRKSGEGFPVEISASFLDHRGRKSFVLTIRSISERYQAQKRLEQSEQKFRQMAENIREVLYTFDVRSGRLEYVSPVYEEVCGLPCQRVYDNPGTFLETVHPEDRDRVIEASLKAGQGEVTSLEYRVVRPDGSIRWIWNRAFPIVEEDGVRRVTGLAEDITERRQGENLLRESEARFRTVADSAPVLIWMSGTDQFCTFFNQTWLDFTGRSLEQEMGNGWAQGVHRDDVSAALNTYVRAFEARQPFTMEYRLRRHDGEYRWISDHGVPRYHAGAEFAGYIGSCEDITERKRAESLLRESEARFRAIADSAPVLIWVAGTDKRCTFCNKSWLDFTGRTLEQEMGDGWAASIHPDDVPGALNTYVGAFEARRPFTMEYRLRRHDGEYRWFSDHGVPRYHGGGEFAGYIGSCVDITERKAARDALQHSEERFRQIAQNVSDFIWEIDNNGIFTYASGSVERILGYRPEELVGHARIYYLFVPELWSQLKAELIQVVARAQPLRTFPSENVCKDGRRVHLESSAVPVLNAAGKLIGYRGASSDVTIRKMAEAALRKSFVEIKELKDRLQAETEYLRAEIKLTQSFGEIIGQSSAIRHVLHQIEQVAAADCAVLITGETGTGKELVARAIHRLSPRKERAMVKVNCAALPSALVESELFGRERGAFTGAMTTQAGRFEIADGSTLFLDEVGELSLEVQAKLLRVLQEGEFERLGSPRTRKVNVRVIAATNRDLVEEVRNGGFRQDLFYRLSVFPIKVPPLRERADDIPALVSTFVSEFGSRMKRKITKLPRRTLAMLQGHSWPGNIRQLRNVLEHAVIISTSETLCVPPLADSPDQRSVSEPSTALADNEREHILRIFEKTGGRIKGPQGAAKLLGMNPATLYSRMRKLGITNRPQKT